MPSVKNKLLKLLEKSGSLTRLADLTGFTEVNLPVWAAIRPNGKSGSCTVGKGLSKLQSKLSALFESYELTCAEKLRPYDLCNLNSNNNRFLFHPPSMYGDKVEFCIGKTICTNFEVHIPFSCLSMDTTRKLDGYRCSTIGMGAGLTQDQALKSAIREFIERYSILKRARNSQFTLLKTDNIHEYACEPVLRRLVEYLTNINYRILVQDLTEVDNWPCFNVRLLASADNGSMVGSGYGCSQNWCKSLIQAILEANQGMCVAASGIRDDMYKSLYLINRSEKSRWRKETNSEYPEIKIDNLLAINQSKKPLYDEEKIINDLFVFEYPRLDSEDTFSCIKVLQPVK
jgi:YcaO-like protein with predicted kinase domain